MSKEMNIEEAIKILEKMRRENINASVNACTGAMCEIWRNEAKALETVLRGLNRYIESDYETICLENNHLLEQLEKEEERRKCFECNFETLQADINSVIKDLGLTEDLIIADEMVQEIKQKYISKDKIKEKIEVLKMEEHYDYIDNKKEIQVLQELLEKEK